MDAKKELGNRLRSARERARFTQKYAAEKIGIHNSTLGKYELGEREPDLETIKKIAELYDVPPEWLSVGYKNEGSRVQNAIQANDANTTIQLIEEEARKMGLSTDDPVFKKMLSDAFDLLRLARGKDMK